MSNWAVKKLEELDIKDNLTRESERAEALRSSQIHSQAPLLWSELKRVILSNIDTFNAKRKLLDWQEPATLEPGRETLFVGRLDGVRHIFIDYYPSIPRIVCRRYQARVPSVQAMEAGILEYSFDLNMGGGREVWLKQRGGDQFYGVDDVAGQCLDWLV